MISDFYIKQNDTADAIIVTLAYDDGTPIAQDITGCVVKFHMKNSSGTLLVASGTGFIQGDPANKQVGYQWASPDTATASAAATPHEAEFQITYSDARIETFPNTRNIFVHIFPEIA